MQGHNSPSSLEAIRTRVELNQQDLVQILKHVASGSQDTSILKKIDKVYQNFRYLIPLADRSPHLAAVLRQEREVLTDAQLVQQPEKKEERVLTSVGVQKQPLKNYWTEEDDIKFQVELVKYWPDWAKIAESFPTRTLAQMRSHLQKFKLAIAKREGLSSDPNLAFEQFIATKREQLKQRMHS